MRDLLRLVFFLALFGSEVVGAQDNEFNFLPVTLKDSELSSIETMYALQDSRGFIWIATKAGLNMFDGYSFKVYKQDSKDSLSLGGDYIKTIHEDIHGNLVINTDNTVDIFHPTTGKFTHAGSKVGNTIIYNSTFAVHSIQTADRSIFFTSEDELFSYDPGSEIATELDVLAKIGFNARKYGEYLNFNEAPDGTLWIAFDNHLAGYNKELNETYYIDLSYYPEYRGNFVTNLFFYDQNKIGIFSDNAFHTYQFDQDILVEERCYGFPENLAGYHEMYSIHQVKNSKVWFTSTQESRILYFDMTSHSFTSEIIYDENGRTFGQIRSIFQDKQGIWWLASPTNGFFYSYPDNMNLFKHVLSKSESGVQLNHNSIRAIVQARDGKLWIGTDGGGINVYDPYNQSVKVYLHNPDDTTSLASNSVLTLYEDSYGRILAGGYNNGVNVYNEPEDNFIRFSSNPDNPNTLSHHDTRSILEIDEGRYLVALNGGNGLDLLDINQAQVSRYTFDPGKPGGDIPSHWLLAAYKDNMGDFWLGGYGGFGRFDPYTGQSENFNINPSDTNSLSHSWIYSILVDSENTMWVGTAYGLNRYNRKDKTFTSYFEQDGLPNTIICGIAEDTAKNIWISTNKGISRLNKSTMEFSNFDASDGLKVEQFQQGAFHRDEVGNIYFGGNGGLVYFNPANFRKNEYKPPIFITGFQLSYQPVEIGAKDSPLKQHIMFTEKIVLNHKQNMITFNYVALNLMSPKKNQYEYMLEGLDEDWKRVGSRREATYTNLDPGKYTFMVRASNNDGVWNEEGQSVEIVIKAPWWGTWLFRISVMLIVAYIIYLIIQSRMRQTRRDKELLQAKIKEGERALQKQKDEIEKHKQEILEKEQAAMETNWFNKGMTMISEIISQNNNDLNKLAGKLMVVLVDYLGANLGAFYILNQSEEEAPYFSLSGSFAVDSQRIRKTFSTEEGYLGACYKDKQKIIIDNLPENYAKLESGLGTISLSCLIMIPLLLENDLKGVIELASVDKLPEYKINLLEKVAENLASSIEIVQMNDKMKKVVDQLNSHTEELNAQKEEMHQNMEEMLATQEENERIRKQQNDKADLLLEQNATVKKTEVELKKLQRDYDRLHKKFEALKKKK